MTTLLLGLAAWVVFSVVLALVVGPVLSATSARLPPVTRVDNVPRRYN